MEVPAAQPTHHQRSHQLQPHRNLSMYGTVVVTAKLRVPICSVDTQSVLNRLDILVNQVLRGKQTFNVFRDLVSNNCQIVKIAFTVNRCCKMLFPSLLMLNEKKFLTIWFSLFIFYIYVFTFILFSLI